MKGKVALHNLGCKVNAYELEAMQQMLEAAGYEIVPFAPGADVYVINTCTVTNIADRKSRQMLHRAKKMNPQAVVVAAGCYAQAQAGKEKIETDPSIDLIIGNNRKQNLVQILEDYRQGRATEDAVVDLAHGCSYEELSISRTEEHTRAYIKVQDGCNQFCSYCIIPYARGRVRSRRTADVVEEVRRLADSGCQEVVLTGIHLSSYGTDRKEDQETLLSLIEQVHSVEKIARIRLGSLEPGVITEEFVKTISALPRVCPHFHLSLQSGCTATLERMNRRYTADEYREKCLLLRKYYDNPALTTDVITGFPGETEEEFQESMDFVDSIHFYETHIFPYSRREGTRAARMDGQVADPVKKERSRRLILLGQRHRREYMESFLGTVREVLFEEQQTIDGKTFWTGHTMEYLKVAADSEESLENRRVLVRITGFAGEEALTGEVLK